MKLVHPKYELSPILEDQLRGAIQRENDGNRFLQGYEQAEAKYIPKIKKAYTTGLTVGFNAPDKLIVPKIGPVSGFSVAADELNKNESELTRLVTYEMIKEKKRPDPKEYYENIDNYRGTFNSGDMRKALKKSDYRNNLVTEFELGTIYNKKATGKVGTPVNIKMFAGTIIPGLKDIEKTPIKSPHGVIMRQTKVKPQSTPYTPVRRQRSSSTSSPAPLISSHSGVRLKLTFDK